MTPAQALDGDRVGGPPALSVGYPGPEERELTGEELVGQDGRDADPTDRLLGEHARHDDQAEQHRDEEVEEIVPGVDRRESEPERGAEAPPAVARGPEPAPRPPPPEPTLGCHARVTGDGSPGGGSSTTRLACAWLVAAGRHRGTGISLAMVPMTDSASTPRSRGWPVPPLTSTRWASAGTARALTSSGTR